MVIGNVTGRPPWRRRKPILVSRCVYCHGLEESKAHVLLQCPAFGLERLLLVAEVQKVVEQLNFPKVAERLLWTTQLVYSLKFN